MRIDKQSEYVNKTAYTSCIWATCAYLASPLKVSDELAKSSLLRQHTDHVRI